MVSLARHYGVGRNPSIRFGRAGIVRQMDVCTSLIMSGSARPMLLL